LLTRGRSNESFRGQKGVLLSVLGGLPSGEGTTLHQQIYTRIRSAILDGGLAAGSRLPSTRTLARDLGVSRQTTEDAFSQLQAEGFLRRRVGDGSYVSLPDPHLATRGHSILPLRRPEKARSIAARGRRIASGTACREPLAVRPFNAGLPALEAFPYALWHRLLARRSRRSGDKMLGYGEPEGHGPLRKAVASYVRAARGVNCDARQVLILTSSQQALDLAARLLADPGDAVWLEEPAYPGARWAFEGSALRVVPVPVDASGLDVAAGRQRAPNARLAYVSPSHQYPLGVTMTLARRMALLEWARSSGAWIIEDDYDSEFRYDGRPLAALQGLDSSHRVLYLGTFTKVMFPSLRLAYLVLPGDLMESFATARSLVDGHTPTLPQAALADFIEEGHFAGHIRRMRALYGERRDVLVDALRRDVGANLVLGPAEAGFHVAGHLRPGLVEAPVIREGLARDLELRGLSEFYAGEGVPGLVLGFGGLSAPAIRRGVKALAAALAAGSPKRPPRRG
jgi:GntR family transcriptional regulator/MocR family aminotransferase